jgi:hypothetical protein
MICPLGEFCESELVRFFLYGEQPDVGVVCLLEKGDCRQHAHKGGHCQQWVYDFFGSLYVGCPANGLVVSCGVCA